jgi:tetratricopeptide (TPR) repeat protein
VILVFEDVQWADPSLLDFVDYLLNWSRNHPLFVLALARPEVADRFPGWSAGRRGVSTMYLEPLGRDDMERLLDGLAPGLPDAVRIEVLDRAEGVPLYAVETVRMLLDRGLLAREGSVYRPTGPIDDLAVPETLHALIAARLDGLPHDERTALQDAAVVGKTFSVAALAAVGDRDEPSVQANVDALVRKEVLAIQADPRSPERGQYVFLQDLVRRVAYDTLSRRDRKARHLAVAAFIEAGWTGEEAEIAEVLASHYLDAHRALPDDPDAPEIKAAARDALVRAATRSESLAARLEALGYFEQAIELTDEPSLRAELFGRAGRMAFAAARIERGRELFDAAAALDRELGDDVALARIEIERAYMATADGRIEEGRDGLIRALATLSDREADADVARAAAELGRMSYFLGRIDEALESIERALPIAEALFIPDVLAEALNTKAIIMASRGRRQEAEALLRHALALALEHDAAAAALRAYNNLVSTLGWRMPLEEQLDMFRRGAELARRIGHAGWQAKFLSDSVPTFVAAGRWDEAIAADDEARAAPDTASMAAAVMERTALVEVYAARSEFERAEAALSADVLEASEDVQAVRVLALARAWIAFHQERYEDAIALARPEGMQDPGLAGVATLGERGMVLATDAALALADLDRAREMVARTEASVPGPGSPYLDAHLARLRGRLAASDRDDEAARTAFDAAVAGLRGLGLRYDLAIALAQRGTWLADAGHADEADVALTEARRIFEDLRATWWLERLPSRRPDAMPAGRLDPISAEA